MTILIMRHGFGFNTNLFETNVLNLAVVIGVVVTVVGDRVSTLLDQRRQIVLATLTEADRKVQESQRRLEEVRNSVEVARLRSEEIRTQAIQTVEQENAAIQRQLKESIQYLQEGNRRSIELERQRIVRTITQKVATLALTNTEDTLLTAFTKTYTKQKELNKKHIRETFRELKR